jgi:hypothetical protein
VADGLSAVCEPCPRVLGTPSLFLRLARFFPFLLGIESTRVVGEEQDSDDRYHCQSTALLAVGGVTFGRMPADKPFQWRR